jgi:predicted AlkP superfamily phosphohydrolase/phosphomutase
MLDPMIESGRLPVLARLLSGGARGILQSTMPPVTCPAWPTMYTGRSPCVHGYLSFRVLEPGTLARRTVMLQDVRQPRLWTVLNRAGVRTGLFNVPVTYPADRVDGFMISGFVTPPGGQGAIQPESLREAFRQAFPAYDYNGPHEGALFNNRAKREGLVRRLRDCVEQRGAALAWFLDREPVDFLWVVLEAIDRISHYAYAFLTPDSALYDTPEAREVRDWTLDLMEAQDRVIGRILERMGPDPLVMVVSDHGFAWTPRGFDLRGWLIDKGLMAPPRGLNPWRRFKRAVRSVVGRWMGEGAVERIVRARARVTGFEGDEHGGVTWDWERSQTWLSWPIEYGIRVNTRSRHSLGLVTDDEYGDVVRRIVKELGKETDPETGRPVFTQVACREDVCTGEHVERSPDVLFLPQRHIYHDRPAQRARGGALLSPAPDLFSQNHHDAEGVFAVVGEPFRTGAVSGARIIDVMPTLLHAMGLSIPDDLEGRVVSEAFTEAHRAAHPVRQEASAGGEGEAGGGSGESYSAEQEQAIIDRLSELGYM